MPNVSYVRPEAQAFYTEYDEIADCLAGETAVKKRGSVYLPIPNAADTSRENKARYAAYLKRAVFYNVAARTHAGLVGAVFGVPPTIELPAVAQPLMANANGVGAGLEQLAKQSVGRVVGYGRGGLLVDYPHVEGTEGEATSVAQLQSGNLRPTIELYNEKEIINWRTRVDGGVEKLSLVVMREQYIVSDDGFEIKKKEQFRVLRLDESGEYVQELWREKQRVGVTFKPRDANGAFFDEIPFYFMGADDNSPEVARPPMYSIVSLNLAHYRNSADYEESLFLVGQPTPVYTGLTENWINNIWKGKTIPFGSRAAITLPANASAFLLQAQPNTLPLEGMREKEKQMIALGAKLVEPNGGPQKTAYEAAANEASENSTLTAAAKNVSAAFNGALATAQRFFGSSEAFEFEINSDFELATLGTEERRQVISEWMQNAITFDEMRAQLRRAGVATEKDDAAKAKIEQDAIKEAETFGDDE